MARKIASQFCRYFSNITVEDRGCVRIISINRPHVRNCVDRATATELYEAFKNFDDDKEALVGVLAGNGEHFCSGYDLSELESFKKIDEHIESFSADKQAPMGPSRLMLSKPVIASMSGYAVAGGLELALWCDLRVAEKNTKMGVFCRRFGVPLIDGGTVRLPALIGMSQAMDMILTGREVDAAEAHNIVPEGQGLDEAVKLANLIAQFPQACMRNDRRSAYNSHALIKLLQYEYENGVTVLPEAVENAAKFVKLGVGRGGKL